MTKRIGHLPRSRKYYVVNQAQGGLWHQVGFFWWKAEADRFRAKVPGQTRVVHTLPSVNYPVRA
jgi:hypothetical protein